MLSADTNPLNNRRLLEDCVLQTLKCFMKLMNKDTELYETVLFGLSVDTAYVR